MPYKDPEKYAEYQRNYRIANRERLLKYRAGRRDRDALLFREWSARNPESNRVRCGARRARRINQFVEDVHPLVVLEHEDGLCGICGKDVDPLNFHVDHIIPLAAGGEHSYLNTQVAHPYCNLSKGDRVY